MKIHYRPKEGVTMDEKLKKYRNTLSGIAFLVSCCCRSSLYGNWLSSSLRWKNGFCRARLIFSSRLQK